MHKLIVDGKEIELDEKNLVPLSEEELDCASGGAMAYHIRWICLDCGFTGSWGSGSRVSQYEMNFHYSQTGHYHFSTDGQYFDADVAIPE